MKIQAVSIIRNKGQLTLPVSIRKTLKWLTPMSTVSIYISKPDEIIIRPHQNNIDWNHIWNGIEKSRSIKRKGTTTSTSKFLEHDRDSH